MRSQNTRIGIMFAGALVCAQAQWLNYPAPGTPRTRDGKPNLSAPAPRTTNAKPELSGVWQAEPAPPGEIQRLFGDISFTAVPGDDPRTFSKYFFNILADIKPEERPLRREGAAEPTRGRAKALEEDDSPTTHCMPLGIPR